MTSLSRIAGQVPGISQLLMAAFLLCMLQSSAEARWQLYRRYETPMKPPYAMCEDSTGNIWFLGGSVQRYDGVNWQTYDTGTALGDTVSVIAALVDRSGALWLGTYDSEQEKSAGIIRFDGQEWTTFVLPNRYSWNVTAILEDHSGNLWFTGSGGVSRFDGRDWTLIDPHLTWETGGEVWSAHMDASSIAEDGRGVIWVGTGWCPPSRLEGTRWELAFQDLAPEWWRISKIICARTGDLWFATNAGAIRYDGVTPHLLTAADGLLENTVYDVVEDVEGGLWFAHPSGLSRYYGGAWQTYPASEENSLSYPQRLLADRTGNLWIRMGSISNVVRFDRADLRLLTEADGLASKYLRSVLRDRSGNLWVGTGEGLSRFDGHAWTTFTEADGLINRQVTALLEDRDGNIWAGSSTVLQGGSFGINRFDGRSWTTLREGIKVHSIYQGDDGVLWFGGEKDSFFTWDGQEFKGSDLDPGVAPILGGGWIDAITEDKRGAMWFATYGGGVVRFDGSSWERFFSEDHEDGKYLGFSLLVDHSGNVWYGSRGGVSRYDGAHWTTFDRQSGLTFPYAVSLLEDREGYIWVGTDSGLERFDGANWVPILPGAPFSNDFPGYVYGISQDPSGGFWLAFGALGLVYYEMDRVPPQTVILGRPPALSSNTIMEVPFTAAFGETEPIEFSYSLDDLSWSEWSSISFWSGQGLGDGVHVFRVRGRDRFGNIDMSPAECTFEIDATPPMPVIASPASGQAVRGSVVIRGTAADSRFERYRLDVRPAGGTWTFLRESSSPVLDGSLADWDTRRLVDGDYEMRLAVIDTLGLVGASAVRIIVDNEAPWVDETAPAVVSSALGGDVYTGKEEVHLYFPPRAFARDTEVRIARLGAGDVPDTLENGARLVPGGHEITWSGEKLAKAVVLDMSYAGAACEVNACGGTPAIYMLGAGSGWGRLGGTVDRAAAKVAATITEPGKYSLFVETVAPAGEGSLSGVLVTPRVFSPGGTFADDEAAIGFTLGRSGTVTVKIYNRAGRLVREVASNRQMNVGANLVSWDGRDADSNQVEGGLYLVVVEALGKTQTKTIAVVR
jgi:ligand-binding sensor domain-containing protein